MRGGKKDARIGVERTGSGLAELASRSDEHDGRRERVEVEGHQSFLVM